MVDFLAGFMPVFASLILVVVSIIISRYLKLGIEGELFLGTFRSFAQLLLVGFILEYIFSIDNLVLFMGVIFVMALIGGKTVRDRARAIPNAFWLGTVSILCGAYFSIGLMIALDIISTDPKYIIPLGGMVVGNSMTACALSLERFYQDLKGNRAKVELALSFGATSNEASVFFLRQAIRAGMIPMLNFLKIVGIVQLPGAMTGMILAGASPIEAVKIQIIVVYMLIAGSSISTSLATVLSRRRLFNRRHQIVIE